MATCGVFRGPGISTSTSLSSSSFSVRVANGGVFHLTEAVPERNYVDEQIENRLKRHKSKRASPEPT